MEAVVSRSSSVAPRSFLSGVDCQSRSAQRSRADGLTSSLCNASKFSESLQLGKSRSQRRLRSPVSASYSHGGQPEQPAWGSITDQDLVVLRQRIQTMREKERQLRISVSWFGKDMEASFFQRAQDDILVAGSSLQWVNNPMIMSVLSMAPLYLIYIAFMVGCASHGDINTIIS